MYKKGTVILIPFPFTDLSASKVRPAVILSNNKLPGDDIITAFISSNTNKRLHPSDILIKTTEKKFKETGLKSDSIIKINKLATLDKKIVLGELGYLNNNTLNKINQKIKLIFSL